MSPITSTPAARASATDQCGAGCVSGTPGASTSADSLDQSTSRRSAVGMPALVALTTESALSSQPTTSAPPASSALALASPDPPRPKMATFFPAKTVTGIMPGYCDDGHRNFSVDSPASASTTETIQKRITICGSVQPSCSK